MESSTLSVGYISKNAVDTAIISVSSKGMLGGNVTAILGFLSSSGFAVFVGTVVTIAGFISAHVFQRRRDAREARYAEADEKRKQELHLLQIRELQNHEHK